MCAIGEGSVESSHSSIYQTIFHIVILLNFYQSHDQEMVLHFLNSSFSVLIHLTWNKYFNIYFLAIHISFWGWHVLILCFVLLIMLYALFLLISRSSFCALDSNPLLGLCTEVILFLYVIFSSNFFSVSFVEQKFL